MESFTIQCKQCGSRDVYFIRVLKSTMESIVTLVYVKCSNCKITEEVAKL